MHKVRTIMLMVSLNNTMKKISRQRLINLKISADYALEWAERLILYSQEVKGQPTALQSKNIRFCVNDVQTYAQAAIRNILAILK